MFYPSDTCLKLLEERVHSVLSLVVSAVASAPQQPNNGRKFRFQG